jgi:hypothetical protein
MSEREHGATSPHEAATAETTVSAATPVPPVQPAPQRTRISNLSRWIDRDRQLNYAGPLAPQDRYPGRIATP